MFFQILVALKVARNGAFMLIILVYTFFFKGNINLIWTIKIFYITASIHARWPAGWHWLTGWPAIWLILREFLKYFLYIQVYYFYIGWIEQFFLNPNNPSPRRENSAPRFKLLSYSMQYLYQHLHHLDWFINIYKTYHWLIICNTYRLDFIAFNY